jgi:phosphohistidine phosphatase
MEKRIYLLRHAEAEIGVSGAADHSRPLSAFGVSQAQEVAQYMQLHQYIPQTVLCSDSYRTAQTCNAIVEAISISEVTFLKSLYNASHETVVEEITALGEDVNSVLVIGHNPGISKVVFDFNIAGCEGYDLMNFMATAKFVALTVEALQWKQVLHAPIVDCQIFIPQQREA